MKFKTLILALGAGLLLGGPAFAICPTYTWTVNGNFQVQSGTTTDTGGNIWTWSLPAATPVIGNLSLTPATCSPSSIAFKGTASGIADINNATTATFAYTVNAASNTLIVEFAGDWPTCSGGTGFDDITSVKVDGTTSMVLLAKRATAVGQRFHYVYGLMNPPTGAHNITVTTSNPHGFRLTAADYANVSGFGATTTHDNGSCTGVDSTLTTTLTTTKANSVVMLSSIDYANNAAPTAGTGSTFRGCNNSANYVCHWDSGSAVAASGTAYSMTTNHPGGLQGVSHIAVELKN